MHKFFKFLRDHEGKYFDVESNWQNYSTINSPTGNPNGGKPSVIASANVIAPVGFLTKLTGNTVVKTITPPYTDRVHMIAIMYAGVAGSDATGNITVLVTSIALQTVLYIFEPLTQKYTPVQ
jgi:hypothetical protein